jgi:hypothetical protein
MGKSLPSCLAENDHELSLHFTQRLDNVVQTLSEMEAKRNASHSDQHHRLTHAAGPIGQCWPGWSGSQGNADRAITLTPDGSRCKVHGDGTEKRIVLFLRASITEKEGNVSETMEQVRQQAYVRGQQMKHWHTQEQRIVTAEALTILAADFAHLSLFQSNHHLSAGAAHERAGVCERAFLEGYLSQLS